MGNQPQAFREVCMRETGKTPEEISRVPLGARIAQIEAELGRPFAATENPDVLHCSAMPINLRGRVLTRTQAQAQFADDCARLR